MRTDQIRTALLALGREVSAALTLAPMPAKRRKDSPTKVPGRSAAAGTHGRADADDDGGRADAGAGGAVDWQAAFDDLRRQCVLTQAELAEALRGRAAAEAECGRLRAAAPAAVCPRCSSSHPDWSVRVRTMMGEVHTIACPGGALTSISQVKRGLAVQNHKWQIQQQLVLVVPPANGHEAGDIAGAGEVNTAQPLADECTLSSCGVADGGLLDLLIKEISWSPSDRELIEQVRRGGETTTIHHEGRALGPQGSLAIAWALLNEVCVQYFHYFSCKHCGLVCISTSVAFAPTTANR
jgi:hypothetical protein